MRNVGRAVLLPSRMEQYFQKIAASLEQEGFALTDELFDLRLSGELAAEAQALFEHGALREAQIGKGTEQQRLNSVRGDRIRWLQKENLTTAQQQYWESIDGLRMFLSEYFRMSLPWFESHLATYPPGTFYQRHLDQFRETTNRVFSMILYLNKDWQPAHGGQLRLYLEDRIIDVEPWLGQFICFRSDLIEHEVLATTQNRYSITGWMRRDEVPLELQTFKI